MHATALVICGKLFDIEHLSSTQTLLSWLHAFYLFSPLSFLSYFVFSEICWRGLLNTSLYATFMEFCLWIGSIRNSEMTWLSLRCYSSHHLSVAGRLHCKELPCCNKVLLKMCRSQFWIIFWQTSPQWSLM